jgi:hypothetical protein
MELKVVLFLLILTMAIANVGSCAFGYINETYAIPPLQMIKQGHLIEEIKCNLGFEFVIKAEDGSPACVRPETALKLIERGWLDNPSKELIIEGLNDTYKTGEQINFVIKYNEWVGACAQPQVVVKNQSNQTVWESKFITTPCPPDFALHRAVGEMKFGNSELGYLSINQTGSYSIHVFLWIETAKNVTITPES